MNCIPWLKSKFRKNANVGFIKVEPEPEPEPNVDPIFVFSITDSDDDMVGDRDAVDVKKINDP
tara:strand:- start:44 stop:232 length:189 start_codon:yes stop_codon:yes gene_type:complete